MAPKDLVKVTAAHSHDVMPARGGGRHAV